jgi:hypothetical protein
MCPNGQCTIRKGLRTSNLSSCIKFDAGDQVRKPLKPLWIKHIVVRSLYSMQISSLRSQPPFLQIHFAPFSREHPPIHQI